MPTILLVEDESPIDELLAMRLRKRGFEVTISNDGETGVQLAQSLQPDLVLMDWRMPGVDGLEATRRLKLGSDTQEIPIIIISASVMPTEREQAISAGCDDIEEKPVDMNRLTQKISALLDRKKLS